MPNIDFMEEEFELDASEIIVASKRNRASMEAAGFLLLSFLRMPCAAGFVLDRRDADDDDDDLATNVRNPHVLALPLRGDRR